MSSASRRVSVLVAAALLVGAGSDCSADRADKAPAAAAASTAPTSGPSTRTAAIDPDEVRPVAQQILDRRARAIRTGDIRAFLADLDRSDPEFVARQRRWFTNLQRLPIELFELTATLESWPDGFADERWSDLVFIPYVEQWMQLAGFDRKPVTSVYGVTFARTNDRWRIVSDSDVSEHNRQGDQDAPWDFTTIKVLRTDRVLVVFDKGSAPLANRIARWTEESIEAVSAAVPARWPERVVVYAVSDPGTLESFGRAYGDAGAVAFPVWGDRGIVEQRVVINPEWLPHDATWGRALLTHELTHVAVGRIRGRAPTWLEEGLAEYVGTRGVVDLGEPSASWVDRAEHGFETMPSSNTFYGEDTDLNYRLAVEACRYITDRFGERALWDLYVRMKHEVGSASPDANQDSVLRREIHLTSAQLARHAARGVIASSLR